MAGLTFISLTNKELNQIEFFETISKKFPMTVEDFYSRTNFDLSESPTHRVWSHDLLVIKLPSFIKYVFTIWELIIASKNPETENTELTFHDLPEKTFLTEEWMAIQNSYIRIWFITVIPRIHGGYHVHHRYRMIRCGKFNQEIWRPYRLERLQQLWQSDLDSLMFSHAESHRLPLFLKTDMESFETTWKKDTNWILQVKYDGIRVACFLYKDVLVFKSRRGWAVPVPMHIEKIIKDVAKNKKNDPRWEKLVILDGEMYLDGKGSSDVKSLLTISETDESEFLEWRLFDIWYEDEPDAPYRTRLEYLNEINFSPPVYIVEGIDTAEDSWDAIEKKYQDVITKHEGIILRHGSVRFSPGERNHFNLKIRRIITTEFLCKEIWISNKNNILLRGEIAQKQPLVSSISGIHKNVRQRLRDSITKAYHTKNKHPWIGMSFCLSVSDWPPGQSPRGCTIVPEMEHLEIL